MATAAATAGAELVWEALDEYARRPSAIVDTARGAVTDVRSTAARLTGVAGGLLRTARRTMLPAPHSPLNATVGRQRRVAVARAELDDIKKIRKAYGGTVNDVLLTVVTGALREWLLSRGEPVVAGTSVRALVPVSMQDEDAGAGEPGVVLSRGPAGGGAQSRRAAGPAQLRDARESPSTGSRSARTA